MMTWKELPGFRTYWEFFERSGLDGEFDCLVPSSEICSRIIRAIGEIEYCDGGEVKQQEFFRGIRGDFQESGIVREVRRYSRNGEVMYYARVAIRSRFPSGRWGLPYFIVLMLDREFHLLTYTITNNDTTNEKVVFFNSCSEGVNLDNVLFYFDEMMEHGEITIGVPITARQYSPRIRIERNVDGMYQMCWVMNDFPWRFFYETQNKFNAIRFMTCYFEQGIKGIQEMFPWKCGRFGYQFTRYDIQRTQIWQQRERKRAYEQATHC